MPSTILTQGRVTWTNILNPAAEDLQDLSARYPQFHALNLQDCLTELEIPKLDHHDDYLFLVVQFPQWVSPGEIPQPAEVDIFVSRGTLVTSHHRQLPSLDKLFSEVEMDETVRAQRMGSGASPLLHQVLDGLVNDCYPLVYKLDRRIRHIEENLFDTKTRQVLSEIAQTRRTIIALRHILYPQIEIVRALERGNWPFIHDELDLYWGDLGDHLAQLCAILDQHAEVVAGLSETVDTLASHRIDEVIRLLTVVTILTLPLTLLATVLGMNILIPFMGHPLPFYLVLGAGTALTVVLAWYLNRNKWL
jgi:magnesium transporter